MPGFARRMWWLGLALLLAMSSVAAPSASAQGNSDNAHLCQKGGWQTVQRTDGTLFVNQGDCVSYGARGGTIVPIPPPPSISMTFEHAGYYTDGTDLCFGTITYSNFTPNATYFVEIWSRNIAGPGDFWHFGYNETMGLEGNSTQGVGPGTETGPDGERSWQVRLVHNGALFVSDWFLMVC